MLSLKNGVLWLKSRWWLAALLPALWLRFDLASCNEWFWYDESFSYLVASAPWGALLRATAADVHPPLYYALLKIWLGIVPSLAPAFTIETQARLLSFALSCVALAQYWKLLTRLELPIDQRRLAFGLALYAPGLIWFASEARMYALMEVLVLAIMLQWTPEPGHEMTWGRALLSGPLFGLLALTHNAGLYYCVSLALALAVRYTIRRAWQPLAAAGAIGFLCWAPWAVFGFARQVSTYSGGRYWIGTPSPLNVATLLYKSFFYIRLPESQPWVYVFGVMLLGWLIVWGLVFERRRWLHIAAYGPAVLGFLVSAVLGAGAIIGRVLIPGSFLAFIPMAGVLRRREGWFLLPVLVALIAAPFMGLISEGRLVRNAADFSFLAQQFEVDVIYAAQSGALPLSVYAQVPVLYAALDDEHGAGLNDGVYPALGLERGDLRDVPAWERAWFVYGDTQFTAEAVSAHGDAILAQYAAQPVPLPDGGRWLWQLTR